MKSIFEFKNLYIHREPVDMRKNINGLGVIVSEEMKLDLKSSSIFIFCNHQGTLMKILYFFKSGFALWMKRLKYSKFSWPRNWNEETIRITAQDMALLLEGINVWTRFEEVHFEHLV